MGFFDSLKSAFSKVGNTISSGLTKVYKAVAPTISSAAKSVGGILSTGAQKAESAVTTVYNDAKSFLVRQSDTVNNLINKGEQLGEKVLDTAGGTISNLGSSLSFPLVIGAAIVGGILLLKN